MTSGLARQSTELWYRCLSSRQMPFWVKGEMQNQCICENSIKYQNTISWLNTIINHYLFCTCILCIETNLTLILSSPNGGWCRKGSTPCRWRSLAVNPQDEKRPRLWYSLQNPTGTWMFPKIGVPKMDGENNGSKPYEQMDDLGIPLFLETLRG